MHLEFTDDNRRVLPQWYWNRRDASTHLLGSRILHYAIYVRYGDLSDVRRKTEQNTVPFRGQL